MRLLIEHGTDINAQAKDGLTPLHNATSNKQMKTIRLLLDHGADIDAEDKEGSTPLHIASSKHHPDHIS